MPPTHWDLSRVWIIGRQVLICGQSVNTVMVWAHCDKKITLLQSLGVQEITNKSTVKCKTAVTPLLMHWGYCSLALSQWIIISPKSAKMATMVQTIFPSDMFWKKIELWLCWNVTCSQCPTRDQWVITTWHINIIQTFTHTVRVASLAPDNHAKFWFSFLLALTCSSTKIEFLGLWSDWP